MLLNKYLLSKIWKSILIKIVARNNRLFPGIYGYYNGVEIKSVGFDLSDEKYIHIGDQLFFEPILRHMTNAGLDIKIAPTNSMRDYFRCAGYSIVEPAEIFLQDLLISSIWMHTEFHSKNFKNNHIYLNSAEHGVSGPISNHFVTHLFKILNIEGDMEDLDCRPYRVQGECPFFLERPVFIYSDTVDSGKFRISSENRSTLENKAKAKISEGFGIIRVGSLDDKKSNPSELPFPNIDFRGKTSVIDLFKLINSPNVIGSISFDTAIAHISILYNKEAYICMRKFSNQHIEFVKKYIFPSYIPKFPAKIYFL
jgi:hypothetical protein